MWPARTTVGPPGFPLYAYLRLGDVIPDHGHLMHLFLLRVPDLDAMWHLHPDPRQERVCAGLARYARGRYQVFADVVDPRGFPWTLVGSIDLPQIAAGKPLAGDDSTWSGGPLVAPLPIPQTRRCRMAAASSGTAPRAPLKANVPMEFTFAVQDKDGRAAQDMEPYMGMAGHAEFVVPI